MSDKATDKRPQFFLVEDAVIERFNLTPYEGWLYIVIVKHANRTTGEAFPGIARLCELANMSRSQVVRAIKSLEEKHLIRVERDEIPVKGEKRQRNVNHYFVLSATGSAYQKLPVVSTSDYGNTSQELVVVSKVDCNKNQLEPESIKESAPNGTDTPLVKSAKREPNPMFDAVAQYVFEIEPETVTKEGGRIGILTAWLSGKSDGVKRGKKREEVGYISAPAKPEHVQMFAAYWKSVKHGADLPLDLVKFVDAWRQWATSVKVNGTKRAETNGKNELHSTLMLGGMEV